MFRNLLISLILAANYVVLVYLMVHALCFLAQLILATLEIKKYFYKVRQADPWWLMTSGVSFPISILVPAHNEESTIVENINSLLALHYPEFEVVVINDGSTDMTLQRIIESFKLKPVQRAFSEEVKHKPIRGIYGSPSYPRLLVIDKENGGKSDALNAGINLSRHPIFCAVDADSILSPDSLLKVVRPFIEEPEEMIAAGGRIKIANGCEVHAGQIIKEGLPRKLVPLFQIVEYTRAFLMARLAWTKLDAMLIISGAFGVFDRTAAIKVGGYSHGTVGEDMEIVVKLHKFHRENKIKYQMRYVPDPVCWTEAPANLSVLRRQRCRWQRGLLETLWKHSDMIFSFKYGPPGIIGMSYFFLMDVVGPVIEVFGFVITPISWLCGVLSAQFFLAYLSLSIAFGIFMSVGSFIFEELTLRKNRNLSELLILGGTAILENFGYRQIANLWRVEGLIQFLKGGQGWGKMTRTGFSSTARKRSS
jgi:cellulose synthase/poly-beta-1,6-N-acetylglucosamine synthase-like glycosyltransferase